MPRIQPDTWLLRFPAPVVAAGVDAAASAATAPVADEPADEDEEVLSVEFAEESVLPARSSG